MMSRGLEGDNLGTVLMFTQKDWGKLYNSTWLGCEPSVS